jgi:hypothetical protein
MPDGQIDYAPETTGALAPEGELIAGKYKTEADLDQGILELVRSQNKDVTSKTAFYKSLESGIGKTPAPAVAPAEAPPAPEATPPPPADLAIPEAIKPVDFNKYTQEYTEKGTLSPETYADIAKEYKLDKGTVDLWIDGQKALAEQHASKVYDRAGGEKTFNEMITWGTQNMTPEEIVQFNDGVANRDPAKWGMAVDALVTRYTRVNGNPPRILEGDMGGPAGQAGFSSRAEQTAAINDPRYAKDSGYRLMVRNRIARSNF